MSIDTQLVRIDLRTQRSHGHFTGYKYFFHKYTYNLSKTFQGLIIMKNAANSKVNESHKKALLCKNKNL